MVPMRLLKVSRTRSAEVSSKTALTRSLKLFLELMETSISLESSDVPDGIVGNIKSESVEDAIMVVDVVGMVLVVEVVVTVVVTVDAVVVVGVLVTVIVVEAVVHRCCSC